MTLFDRKLFQVTVRNAHRPYLMNQERKDNHWTRSAATKLWRLTAHEALTRLRPELPDGRILVVSRPYYDKGPLPDPGNDYPTTKAIVDGFVDYGLVPDDDDEHVAGVCLLAPILDRNLRSPEVRVGVYLQ